MTIQLRTGISDKYVIDRKENLNDQERLIPGKHFWFVKRELRKLTAMVLSLNIKRLHSHRLNPKKDKFSSKRHPYLYEAGVLSTFRSFREKL